VFLNISAFVNATVSVVF